jgi:hypothetical protein
MVAGDFRSACMRAVQRQPGYRIQQRAHQPAVHAAVGVVHRPVGLAGEHDLAGFGVNQIELHERGDRGWRKLAGDHRLEIVDPGHGQAARHAGARVVPYDGP